MGLIAAFSAAVFGSSKDLLSKRLSFDVDGSVSTFASFFYALPYYALLLLILYFMGIEDFTFSAQFLMFVVLRSLTDAGAEWCKMNAYSHGDISFVASFLALSPMILLVTSPLITGDQISWGGASAVFLAALGGFLLVFRPMRSKEVPLKGVAFALGGATFFSLNTCFDRLAVQEASAVLSGAAMTALACLVVLPGMFMAKGRFASFWKYRKGFLARGFFEISFMVCKLIALQYMAAPYAAGIAQSSLLLSIIGGRIFFKEKDFLLRLFAGLLICSGIVWIVLEL